MLSTEYIIATILEQALYETTYITIHFITMDKPIAVLGFRFDYSATTWDEMGGGSLKNNLFYGNNANVTFGQSNQTAAEACPLSSTQG